jgi:hypothetical protein
MGQQRKPDYILKAMDKITNDKGRIGAAWVEEDGSVSVIVDRFAFLSGSENVVLKLFPNDKAKP